MNTSQDRYNITTFDRDGAPDMLISNVDTATAQAYIKELEAEGVDYHIQLRDREAA